MGGTDLGERKMTEAAFQKFPTRLERQAPGNMKECRLLSRIGHTSHGKGWM